MITTNKLQQALNSLHIPYNSDLLVHSSMRSFGEPMEGGIETLLQVLMERVGQKGTLVMPTLSFSSFQEDNPFFDAKRTPSDCGILTEVFRKYPNVIRSMHPVSSACAWGARAEYFTKQHEDTPCGINTPYGKLVSENAWVLFIGTTFGSNTVFHVAEEIVSPSYLCYAPISQVCMSHADGTQYTASFRRYNCSQTGIIRDLARMEPVFEKANVLHRVQVGESVWTAIPASINCSISCDILRKIPTFILKS